MLCSTARVSLMFSWHVATKYWASLISLLNYHKGHQRHKDSRLVPLSELAQREDRQALQLWIRLMCRLALSHSEQAFIRGRDLSGQAL
jgi:hypothetical protein